MKDSFILYQEHKEIFDMLTDEEAGRLIKAIFEYERGQLVELDKTLQIAFVSIKNSLDRNREKTRTGKYHWNWKGGITSENHKERCSTKYKKWRTEVFERDNYICQACKQKGKKLNAHHIEKFSVNKLRRFDVNNGITLCEKCHRRMHKNER